MPINLKILFVALTTFIGCRIALPAQAAFVTWDVSANSAAGYSHSTVSGAFTYNTETHTFPDFSITVSSFPGSDFALNPSNAVESYSPPAPFSSLGAAFGFTQPQGLTDGVDILLGAGDLNQTYGSLPITFFSQIVAANGTPFFIPNIGGEITEVSATPLPPALPLFGSALLALACFAAWSRRRPARG